MTASHQGLPVAGYTAQTGEAVALVNANKVTEERLLRLMDGLATSADVDQRWLAVARRHFRQGFMELNRTIFHPDRISLPEDAE